MLRLDLNLVWTILNLLILYLLMMKFLFKPVQKMIAARQAETEEAFKQAQDKQDKAQELQTQYEASMKEVEGTKAAAVAEAKKTAAAEYQKMMNEAEGKAKSIVEDAKLMAEHEKKQIMKSAETEIADLVMDAAAKVAGAKKSEEMDRALFDQFISKAE